MYDDTYTISKEDALCLLELLAQAANHADTHGVNCVAHALAQVAFATIGSLTDDPDERDQIAEYLIAFAKNDQDEQFGALGY